MTVAMFKLESFAPALSGMDRIRANDRAALDQAYADGLAEGLRRQEAQQIRNLQDMIDRLAQMLADDEARLARQRSEAVATLAPVLHHILDCLAPGTESRRLEAALTNELMRLSQEAPALRASLTCGPSLRAMVDRCLAQAGIDTIAVTTGDCDVVNLTVEGGRIEFSPARMAAQIRALIDEIREGGA